MEQSIPTQTLLENQFQKLLKSHSIEKFDAGLKVMVNEIFREHGEFPLLDILKAVFECKEIPQMLLKSFEELYPKNIICHDTRVNRDTLFHLIYSINIIADLINYLDENMRNEPFIFYINYFSANYENYDDFPVTTLYDFYNSFISYLYALEHNTVPVKNTIQ